MSVHSACRLCTTCCKSLPASGAASAGPCPRLCVDGVWLSGCAGSGCCRGSGAGSLGAACAASSSAPSCASCSALRCDFRSDGSADERYRVLTARCAAFPTGPLNSRRRKGWRAKSRPTAYSWRPVRCVPRKRGVHTALGAEDWAWAAFKPCVAWAAATHVAARQPRQRLECGPVRGAVEGHMRGSGALCVAAQRNPADGADLRAGRRVPAEEEVDVVGRARAGPRLPLSGRIRRVPRQRASLGPLAGAGPRGGPRTAGDGRPTR